MRQINLLRIQGVEANFRPKIRIQQCIWVNYGQNDHDVGSLNIEVIMLGMEGIKKNRMC